MIEGDVHRKIRGAPTRVLKSPENPCGYGGGGGGGGGAAAAAAAAAAASPRGGRGGGGGGRGFGGESYLRARSSAFAAHDP